MSGRQQVIFLSASITNLVEVEWLYFYFRLFMCVCLGKLSSILTEAPIGDKRSKSQVKVKGHRDFNKKRPSSVVKRYIHRLTIKSDRDFGFESQPSHASLHVCFSVCIACIYTLLFLHSFNCLCVCLLLCFCTFFF